MFETIYTLSGVLALAGWAGLIFLPRSDVAVRMLARALIPGVFALVYIYLMMNHYAAAPEAGGFGSLAGIKVYFAVDALLLAAWLHYLAMDLFVGSWEVVDAQERGLPHLLVVPCLLLTVIAGPTGLLAYLITRTFYEKRQPRLTGTRQPST